MQEKIARCVQLCESTQNPAALLWILPMDFKICVQYVRAFPEFVNFMTQFEKASSAVSAVILHETGPLDAVQGKEKGFFAGFQAGTNRLRFHRAGI